MAASPETTLDSAKARRISPTAILILIVWGASGAALSLIAPQSGLITFVFVLTGWVLSVMAHEFGHAWAAYRGGDWTVASKGYLTLDPLRYIDGLTSLILPLIVLAIGGVGLPGGAVYLRQDLMRSPLWRSIASLAGPAATFAALFVLATAYGVVGALAPDATPLLAALAFLAFLQATALILNLLPVPGLDGFGALRPFLPRGLARLADRYQTLIFLGFIVLLLSGAGVTRELFGAAVLLTRLLGVPGGAVRDGYDAFRFWEPP